jgi:hypothetical protein
MFSLIQPHFAKLSWFYDIYELGKIHRMQTAARPCTSSRLRELMGKW